MWYALPNRQKIRLKEMITHDYRLLVCGAMQFVFRRVHRAEKRD